MQQREQSYRLFEPSSKPWPLNNHRAEFARKLIVYAVGATVREYAGQAIAKNFHRKSNEVTSHLFFDVFATFLHLSYFLNKKRSIPFSMITTTRIIMAV